MTLTGKKRAPVGKKSVPYHGQKPHTQGKRPHPLLCFSWNLRNAFKKAFAGFQEDSKDKKCEDKPRIECLMDLFLFDINQLLIYENRNKTPKNEKVGDCLRGMKLKVAEVKTLATSSKSLSNAEGMLKRRARLKCTARSLRRQLIEHLANFSSSQPTSKTVCEIMKQLDGMDADIHALCKCVILKTTAASSTDLVKKTTETKKELPSICSEMMRPYDPAIDKSSHSIHLRYLPALDSFKAGMARQPDGLRLPYMCPPMKRIMNKMKPNYLMDDVPFKPPCKMDIRQFRHETRSRPPNVIREYSGNKDIAEYDKNKNIAEYDGNKNIAEYDGDKNIPLHDGKKNILLREGKKNIIFEYDGNKNIPQHDGKKNIPEYDGNKNIPLHDGNK